MPQLLSAGRYFIMPVSFKVKPEAYIFLAILILTVPVPWVAAALFAAYIHELCHIIVIILSNSCVYSIVVGASGAKLYTSPLSRFQELFCAAAGPCGSLLLLCFYKWIPRIALCGLIQGLFNLLPFYPMDGGRIFRCIKDRIVSSNRKIPCKDA